MSAKGNKSELVAHFFFKKTFQRTQVDVTSTVATRVPSDSYVYYVYFFVSMYRVDNRSPCTNLDFSGQIYVIQHMLAGLGLYYSVPGTDLALYLIAAGQDLDYLYCRS